MRGDLKNLFSDRINRYAVFLSLALLLAGMIAFLIKVWNLPPLVPLFYNRPWGMSQLGEPNKLLLLLLLALGVFVINIAFSLRFFKEVVLLTRILLWISALVSLLAATVVLRVVFLVT